MKKRAEYALFVFCCGLAALAIAGQGRQASVNLTTAAPWGVPPTAITDGVPLTDMEYVGCSIHGLDSTFEGGAACWYRNPNEAVGSVSAFAGDAGWEIMGSMKQTATGVTDPDGGAVRRYSFPSLKVGMRHGRIICVGCPLTGTADDGGVARFRVRTEAWRN